MVAKAECGVIKLNKVFKTQQGKLVECEIKDLGLDLKGANKVMCYALAMVRSCHVRLNQWDTIEIDIVEDRINSKIIDVNFLKEGKDTHRVLGIKLVDGSAVSFETVSVHPT